MFRMFWHAEALKIPISKTKGPCLTSAATDLARRSVGDLWASWPSASTGAALGFYVIYHYMSGLHLQHLKWWKHLNSIILFQNNMIEITKYFNHCSPMVKTRSLINQEILDILFVFTHSCWFLPPGNAGGASDKNLHVTAWLQVLILTFRLQLALVTVPWEQNV